MHRLYIVYSVVCNAHIGQECGLDGFIEADIQTVGIDDLALWLGIDMGTPEPWCFGRAVTMVRHSMTSSL